MNELTGLYFYNNYNQCKKFFPKLALVPIPTENVYEMFK